MVYTVYEEGTEVPLCPGGQEKEVKAANLKKYVDVDVKEYFLDRLIEKEFTAFNDGTKMAVN